MKRSILIALGALVAIPAAAFGQSTSTVPQPANAFAAAVKAAADRAMRNLPAAADDMPAERYTFRPTPEQEPFAEIIAHEASSNEARCSALAGATPPPGPAPTHDMPKDQLVARLRQAYGICAGVVGSLTETGLGDSVQLGPRKVTKAALVVGLLQGWADHYAQAAMYLRLNGILPPTARARR